MRIIRMKIKGDVKTLLRKEARKFNISDAGYVEDLYALIRLKGHGLPTKERIAAMAKSAAKRKSGTSEMSINLLVAKRKMSFDELIKLPYFVALTRLTNPIEAVTRLLIRMKRLYAKNRQVQCATCQFMKDCDFGKQYSRGMKDITKVIDPDFEQKVHQDCPVRPDIEGQQQMVEAFRAFSSLVQQAQNQAQQNLLNANAANGANVTPAAEQAEAMQADEPDVAQDDGTDEESLNEENDADFYVDQMAQSDGKPRSGVFDGRLDGNGLCDVSEQLIERISIQQLMLFELGKKFSQELVAQKKGKFAPVSDVEVNKDQNKIEKLSDLPKVEASQHGLPQEVFDARLEKKQLSKIQYKRPNDKKKLLYLLIDISASMLYWLGDGNPQNSIFTRSSLATLFSMACARRVRDDQGYVFSRFFTGNVSSLTAARTPEEFELLLNVLSLPSCRQGSTNIGQVVKIACEDIKLSQSDLHSAEILLITDCEDSVDTPFIKKLLTDNKVELNTLDVAGGSVNSLAAKQLKDISTRYFKANEKQADVTKIVSLL